LKHHPGLDQATCATENAVRHARVRAIGGIRAIGTGQLIAQPYIGTKLAEFGAEVIHVEKPGGDVFRFTAPQLVRGPRPHGGDEAEVTKNNLSMGLDFKKTRGIELLMALWKISDVWMESSAPGTCERNSITNELALAVNLSLVIVRVSSYGQYGKHEYLGRPGYDAIAQAYGGMMNLTGDPAGPPQRAKSYTGDYATALTGWAATMMALWEVKKTGRGQVIDLAQFEAVAQTNGNTLPIFAGEGSVSGHTGNRPPGFTNSGARLRSCLATSTPPTRKAPSSKRSRNSASRTKIDRAIVVHSEFEHQLGRRRDIGLDPPRF
jgi:crotonobetainyl-CoA:carnitine CoA-transferase CaiB-like acyl-CoA transferase